MTVEDRLKTIETKLDSVMNIASRVEAQLEVITPQDMVQIKTDLARVETRVYSLSAVIAIIATTIAGWVKGLIT